MHELSIAMSILDMTGEEARRRGVAVTAVHLRLGPLSGVSPEALRSAFELARENSDTPRADLVIEEAPLLISCPACGAGRAAVSASELRCVDCGSPAREIVSGRELEVVALEIEE